MVIIDGLSKRFREKISIDENHISDITYYWFQEIDHIYFSSIKDNSVKIKLDTIDKLIMSLSTDCKDKLKTLSFKKNITILSDEF